MSRSLHLFRCACTLAFIWVAVGCHESTAPKQPARLAVSGAPTGPVLVGSTVQLQAAPLDAKGDTLAGRTLTWTSSDIGVATVNSLGLVTGVGAGTATVSVSSGGTTDTIPFDFRVGAVLGPYGGQLALFDDSLTLTVPKEALARATPVMARPIDSTTIPHLVGGAYELSPATLVFAKVARLTLRYDPSRLPAGVTQHSVALYASSGSGWFPVVGATVDTSSRTVTGPISHAASYAVMWANVAGVAIAGATNPDTLYVGEAMQLTAVPYDSSRNSLPLRPASWSSSSPSVAAVDSTGRVAAAAVGTTTLTATVGGQSASFGIVVVGGLVVDWSRARDWTTYQGDASHDGYVPVTMDPRRFHELWNVVPFSSMAPSVAAAADSSVVVAFNSFQSYRIAVLDAATGQTRWNYDFGTVSAVGPPAYVGGTAYVETVGPDSLHLWSFAASTGEIHFRTADGGPYARYQAPTAVGGTIYASNGSGVSAFGAVAGTRQWTTPTSAATPAAVPAPAVGAGDVFAWTAAQIIGLTVLDTAGGVAYTIPDSGFAYDSYGAQYEVPVLGGANDVLVTDGGGLLSLDLAARTIGWKVAGSFGLSPAVAGGVLYVVDNGHVDARSESDGSLLWTFVPPDGAPVAFPCVVSDNLLFVSTGHTTYAVDLASHAPVWSRQPGGALAISRAGVLFISSGAAVTAVALQ